MVHALDGKKKRVYNVNILKQHRYIVKGETLRNIYHCGDVSGEDPPVLIPNTEVKLACAENT